MAAELLRKGPKLELGPGVQVLDMGQRLLTSAQVSERLGIAHSTFRALVAGGEFPKPIRIGRRLVRWPVHTVDRWIAEADRAAAMLASPESGIAH